MNPVLTLMLRTAAGVVALAVIAIGIAGDTRTALAACPSTLTIGETFTCDISVAGEEDQLTFFADAGDRVLLRMAEPGSVPGFTPEVTLFGQGGQLCTNSGSVYAEAICTLDGAGTNLAYTVRARESGNDATGSYGVTVQRLNNPGAYNLLFFGEAVEKTIDQLTDIDTFIINGQQNDRVLIRVSEIGSDADFTPELRVYDAAGIAVPGCATTGAVIAEVICVLNGAGAQNYHLLTMEQEGNNTGPSTGAYGISIQRLNAVDGAQPISFGNTLTNSISPAADVDAFTFSADAGDRVLLRLAEPASDPAFSPELRLYNQSGVLVPSCAVTGPTLAEFTCVIAVTGSHAALVMDEEGNNAGPTTGNYGLSVQRLNNPGNPTGIGYGTTRVQAFPFAADVHTYTFDASQNDRLLIRMAEPTSDPSFNSEFRLFNESGVLVPACGDSGTILAEVECTVTGAGTQTYRLLAMELDGNGIGPVTGTYGITVQRLNVAPGSTPLTFGTTATTTLGQPSAFHTYSFSANQNDRLLIRVSEPGSDASYNPEFRLYNAAGALVAGCADTGTAIAEALCLLPGAGTQTYTLLTMEETGNNWGPAAGAFGVHVQRTNAPVGATPITAGPVLSGTIQPQADVDTFTFSGAQGAMVTLRMREPGTDASFTPEVRLYGPTGTLVAGCLATGSSLAEVTCTLPASGTQPYRFMAMEQNGNAIGAHCVTLNTALASCSAADTDGDGINNIADNCPNDANPGQQNADANLITLNPPKAYNDVTLANSDFMGDACDDDDDNDARSDLSEGTGIGCNGVTSNPILRDTDGDHALDGPECSLGTSPANVADEPTNGACASAAGAGTSQDNDGDGVIDFREYCYYNTSPANPNSDHDICGDGSEVASINGDNSVNVIDFSQIALELGAYASPGTAVKMNFDITKNGSVDVIDLQQAALSFGVCP